MTFYLLAVFLSSSSLQLGPREIQFVQQFLSEQHFYGNTDQQFVYNASGYLLPTGSQEGEVLEVGSIPVAILPSCQYNDQYCVIIA